MTMRWEKDLRVLASRCPQEDVDKAIEDWRVYFERMRLPKSLESEEFDAVMRARVAVGQISLAAPNLDVSEMNESKPIGD